MNRGTILPEDYDFSSKLNDVSRRERLAQAYYQVGHVYSILSLYSFLQTHCLELVEEDEAKLELAHMDQLKRDTAVAKSAKDIIVKVKTEVDQLVKKPL